MKMFLMERNKGRDSKIHAVVVGGELPIRTFSKCGVSFYLFSITVYSCPVYCDTSNIIELN
jgi:hypothetical protein